MPRRASENEAPQSIRWSSRALQRSWSAASALPTGRSHIRGFLAEIRAPGIWNSPRRRRPARSHNRRASRRENQRDKGQRWARCGKAAVKPLSWLIPQAERCRFAPGTELQPWRRRSGGLVGDRRFRHARAPATRSKHRAALVRQIGKSERTRRRGVFGISAITLRLKQALEPAIEFGAAAVAARYLLLPFAAWASARASDTDVEMIVVTPPRSHF